MAELAGLPLIEPVVAERDYLEKAENYVNGRGIRQFYGNHLVFLTRPEAWETYNHWVEMIDKSAPLPRFQFIFPIGLDRYTEGTVVYQPKDGKTYQCLEYPASGYCIQWSEGSNQYEPGVGQNWEMAWRVIDLDANIKARAHTEL